MKDSLRCPRCAHRSILHLPYLTLDDGGALLAYRGSTFSGDRAVIEACVCRGCGYTELYTQGASRIPVDKIKGARILDGADPGPHR